MCEAAPQTDCINEETWFLHIRLIPATQKNESPEELVVKLFGGLLFC